MTAAEYKAERKKRGSQSQVARVLGQCRETVSRRENGAVRLTADDAAELLALPLRTKEGVFWSKVQKAEPDKCWLWKGYRKPDGYGVFCWESSSIYAHRFSLELERGKPLGDLFACHHCDNPPCVNPAHLFLGTHRDNIIDAVSKGRMGKPRPIREKTEAEWDEVERRHREYVAASEAWPKSNRKYQIKAWMEKYNP